MSRHSIHDNWAQNRQATAVCDFCNRKNVPLQKCQDCNINICKQCTSKGKLEDDARHMLARDAADSFEWHRWGKDKNKKRVSSVEKAKPVTRADTPDPEPSAAQADPTQTSEKSGGFSPANRNYQHSPATYGQPIPMMYSQQHMSPLQGSQYLDFPHTGQYPGDFAFPRYPYTPPPYGMYGAPAEQPIYNSYVPRQPQYGLYSPQIPQLSSEFSGLANVPVPSARGQTPHSSQELPAQSEDVQHPSQASGRQMTIQEPPSAARPAFRSIHTTQKEISRIPEQLSTQSEGFQRPEPASDGQSGTETPSSTSEQPSIARKKTQKSSEAPKPSKQAIRRSRHSREISEDSEQDSTQEVTSPACQPAEKYPRANILKVHEGPPRLGFTARAPKRHVQSSEDDDPNSPTEPHAKKLRRNNELQAKVVKLRVKSNVGVQRLRQILQTPQGGSRSSSTSQPGLSSHVLSQSSGSASQPKSSIQTRKGIRIDELLETPGHQPDSDDQLHRDGEWTSSRQLSVRPAENGYQSSSKDLPTQRLPTGDQAEDSEEKEAAMILLAMRHSR